MTTLGIWAWADTYDVFNTAALNGQQVSTALHAVLVKSYGSSSSSGGGDVVSGCSVPAGGPRAASVAIDAIRRACRVNVDAVNSVPAKQLAVYLSITDGAAPDQSAQVCTHTSTGIDVCRDPPHTLLACKT